VQNKFKRVSSKRQLRWKEQLHLGGNHLTKIIYYLLEKLSYISKFTHDKFTAAVESRFIFHDIKLQR